MQRARRVVGSAGITAAGGAVLALSLGAIGSAHGEGNAARDLEHQIHSDGGTVRAAGSGGPRGAAKGGPKLAPQAEGASLERSLATGGVQRSGSFWLATGAGRLETSSAVGDLGAATISRDRRAAVFAGASSSTALGLRPAPVGFTSYARLAGGTRSASWTISLPGRERLRPIHDGGIAVIAPRAQTVPRASTSTRPPRNRAAASGAGVLSAKQGGAYAASLPRGWRLVARISAPVTTDAGGRTVPTALSHSGNRITLRVSGSRHRAGALTARTNWSPTGDLGNGYWSHGADRPVRSSDWSVQRGRRTHRGCGYLERGTLMTNEVEEARDLAVANRGCKSLVETGNPYGSPSPRAGSHSSSPTAVTSRRRRVHRNKAYHKSIQEDPIQIDVNSVKDIVDWRWNRRCVRPLRLYDATKAYRPTGWKLVKRNRVKSRRCKETTMQTYAKFRGGNLFPYCFGSKVTTIYANNIMQGRPRGRAGYYVYRVTGGAPCHKLLHWDRQRRNRRVY